MSDKDIYNVKVTKFEIIFDSFTLLLLSMFAEYVDLSGWVLMATLPAIWRLNRLRVLSYKRIFNGYAYREHVVAEM